MFCEGEGGADKVEKYGEQDKGRGPKKVFLGICPQLWMGGVSSSKLLSEKTMPCLYCIFDHCEPIIFFMKMLKKSVSRKVQNHWGGWVGSDVKKKNVKGKNIF